MKSKRITRQPRLFMFSTLLILLGAALTIFWQVQQSTKIRAEGNNVVGAPTLPAATVEQILQRLGSPMASNGQVIEQAARDTNIDDAFALAVWWAETNDGAAGVGLGYHNPGGVRSSSDYPVGNNSYTIYPTYADSIRDWFNIVKNRYINRGLTTVYTICYPYVGTSGAASWAGKVSNSMLRYQSEVPPPTPTPVPTPSPTPIQNTYIRNHEKIDAATNNFKPVVDVTQTSRKEKIAQPKSRLPEKVAAPPASSTGNLNIWLGLIVLAALTVAYIGKQIRSKNSAHSIIESAVPDTIAVAMNNNHQFQPFSTGAIDSAQQARLTTKQNVMEAETAPLPAIHPTPILPVMQATPIVPVVPVTPVWPLIPPTPIVMPTVGGLLSRYGNGEARPRRIVLLKAGLQKEVGGERHTDTFTLSRNNPAQLEQTPGPDQTASAGLVKRFGDIDEKTRQNLLTK